MEEVPLSQRGRIHSFTVIHVGQEGFEVPYAVGYIGLPEGVRLFGPLKGEGASQEGLAIGMEVEMVPSGRGGFGFRPVTPVKG